MALHSVIMAGGSGTRFWPLSRQDRPKQLLAITSDRTMLRDTAERVTALTPFSRQWVVCGARHEVSARHELPELPASHILVEPLGRNTAPCIGLACIHALKEDPQAILCVLPADAYVADAADFCRHLEAAARSAEAGRITTLGLRPTRPETGYGYVKSGAVLTSGTIAVHAVERFVEKPDLPTAEKYLKDGSYLWNAGIFVFSARQMMEAMGRHLPELHKGLNRLAAAVGTAAYPALLKEIYPALPAISIDYGVMEKESGLAVVPSTFAWSDVGSFTALSQVLPVDQQGNLTRGTVLLHESQGCVVDARAGRVVAVLGATDLVVVDAPGALLVMPRDRAQQVGQLLPRLKDMGREDLL